MGRGKKPGVPGKTTIAPEVVASATERLLSTFNDRGFYMDYEIFVVPQQCYLYVEAARKADPSQGRSAPVNKGSTTHTPLGRLKFIKGDRWEYQRYRWSDAFWDEEDVERGKLENLMSSMLVDMFF